MAALELAIPITERKKAEETLRKNQEEYSSLFANMIDGFAYCQMIFDESGKPVDFVYLQINVAFEKITGLRRESVVGKKVTQAIPGIKEANPELFEIYGRVALTGQTERFEVFFKPLSMWLHISVYCPEKGYFTAIFEDITERKKTEGILEKEQQKLNLIIDSSPIIIFYKDNEGKFVRVNEAFAEALKIPKEEFLGKTVFDFYHAEIARGMANDDLAVLQSGHPRLGIIEQYESASGMRWVQTDKVPILDKNGISTGLIGFAQDITKIKLAEMEMHITANLFNATTDSILVHDLDGKLVYFNEAAYKTRGYTRDEFQELCIQDLEDPNNPGFFGSRMNELLDKGEATFEAVNLCKDKTIVLVEIHARVIELEGRKLVLSVARDVSERKKVEDKLKESEEKYRTTFESSMDALMLLDGKSFLDCNRSTLQLFGCKSVEEFIKNHPSDLSSPTQPDGTPSMEAAMSHINKAFKMGSDSFFWIHKRVDGTTFPADVLLTRIPLGNRNILQGTVRDITELKKAEEAIKFQADLLNHVGQAVIMVDNNRTIRFWNNAAEKLYGWSEEQALGQKVTELLGGTSPEEADEVTKRLMAGESWSTEVLTKNRAGSVVPVILNRTPIYKEDGEFVGAASITTDISLQKNTEADLTFSLIALSNSLGKIEELNEKLRVVGGLTRHDVRNKLSAVTGYAYILKKKHGDQADIVDGLGKMEQAVKDSVKIFEFAKMYEQLGVEELTYVDVETAIDEALGLFSGLNFKVVNDCHGLTVLADSFLRQLFYNFVDNTVKYGEKTTTVRVYYEMAEQDKLKLVYEDDGVGISTENKLKIFTEGFSTGGSTGFGLFLIREMIKVYGWQIQETGEVGQGAKFVLSIPKLDRNGKMNFQIAKRIDELKEN